MIQLLFIFLLIQIAFILILSFANPLRMLLVKALDLLKQGRGPLVTKTVAASMFVVLSSTVYTIIKIQKRSKHAGIDNPTDQVLMAHRLLEASFLGFSLFLGMIIDRQHYYIREINLLRKNLETAKKGNRSNEPSKRRAPVEADKPKVKYMERETVYT